MTDPEIRLQMRQDWDRRAREDACYYTAYGRRSQTEEEFFTTAGDVLHAIQSELDRFPPGTDWRQLAALEIGCGPGRLLAPLSGVFGRVVGVDVSPEMIERARRNLEGIPNASVQLSSGADLAGFAEGSFDFCYSYAVFQHIPSREVVFNYLREARRVLNTGGFLKCQLNGLPEADRRRADTWDGARFDSQEIRRFCREEDFQLLLLEGENTPNLWMTARKQPCRWARALGPVPGARILRITNTYTGDLVVPSAGRFASASLWVENLSPDSDLNNLEVEIAGRRCAPCYLGLGRKGRDQVNVYLPAEAPTGMLRVRLWMLGEPISPFALMRVIPPPPPAPRLLSVTDGVNLLSTTRIETRSLKLNLEEVGETTAAALPAALRVSIDGQALEDLEAFRIDPLAQRYAVNVKIPPEIPEGPHELDVALGRRSFGPLAIQIVDSPPA